MTVLKTTFVPSIVVDIRHVRFNVRCADGVAIAVYVKGVGIRDVAIKDVAIKDVAIRDVAIRDVAIRDVAMQRLYYVLFF
ncbi:hypothetical protein MTBBW1_1790058 [Desulfamplus magnetovallimortis]|uniref:Uncharacterized protein n=1 Tax=Desulfamplus magnetovallimortis TaxID=1246637 RepID=A0A1W1HAG3_9BACT|nr:hypothetical protein [Desulfamplus magnetovallimortis]SLM29433.1 hypothetical protein MTBBW1_1790058 [Desulfamplus magnetovallimortis]